MKMNCIAEYNPSDIVSGLVGSEVIKRDPDNIGCVNRQAFAITIADCWQEAGEYGLFTSSVYADISSEANIT